MTKDEELEQRRQENSALREQVALLSERINELEARLAKDSHNSHLPRLGSLSSAAQESAQEKRQAAWRTDRSCRKHPEAVGDP